MAQTTLKEIEERENTSEDRENTSKELENTSEERENTSGDRSMLNVPQICPNGMERDRKGNCRIVYRD